MKNMNKEARRQEKILYKVLISSLIFGALNWLFWYEQYLNLDYKYYLLFVILPIVTGIVLLRKFFNSYVSYYLDTKIYFEKLLIILFLTIGATIISYASLGTFANMAFKTSMDLYTTNKSSKIESYPIVNFYLAKSSGRNLFERFAKIDYKISSTDEGRLNSNKKNINDFLNDLSPVEIRKRKLQLETKIGFWEIRKIENFKVE